MNNVTLIGRLTGDPEMRFTPTGKAVTKFRLAVPNPANDDKPLFVDVESWTKLAESVASYQAKGRRVGVTGRLAHSQWTADDGSPRSKVYAVANAVDFLDGAAKNGGGGDTEPEPEYAEGEEPF